MISLQDIDVALARAQMLMPTMGRSPAQDEQLVCLSNARQMLQELGSESSETLDRIQDTLDRLSDITRER